MCVHTTTEQLRNPKESSSCHSLKTQHLLFLRRELSGGCRYGHPVKKCSVLAVGRTARSVRKARLPPSSSSGASTCWGRRRGVPRRQRGECSSSRSSRPPARVAMPATVGRVLVGGFFHQRLFLVGAHVQGPESGVLGGWRGARGVK